MFKQGVQVCFLHIVQFDRRFSRFDQNLIAVVTNVAFVLSERIRHLYIRAVRRVDKIRTRPVLLKIKNGGFFHTQRIRLLHILQRIRLQLRLQGIRARRRIQHRTVRNGRICLHLLTAITHKPLETCPQRRTFRNRRRRLHIGKRLRVIRRRPGIFARRIINCRPGSVITGSHTADAAGQHPGAGGFRHQTAGVGVKLFPGFFVTAFFAPQGFNRMTGSLRFGLYSLPVAFADHVFNRHAKGITLADNRQRTDKNNRMGHHRLAGGFVF